MEAAAKKTTTKRKKKTTAKKAATKRTKPTPDAPVVDGEPEPVGPVKSLAETTVVLRLKCGLPSQQKKADSDEVIDKEATDPEIVRVTKKLFDGCPEFEAVATAMGKAKAFVRSRSVKSAAMKDGYYRLPLALVEPTDTYLGEYWDNVMTPLIDAFMARYPEIVALAEERLGKLAEQADFAPESLVRSRFKMSKAYVTMETPDNLKTISNAFFDRERKRAAAEVDSEMADIRDGLRLGMSTLVDRMVDRLTPEADGKKRTFRNSLVENMREFLDLFDAKNVTSDVELAKLTAKARAILAGGIDADSLRKDESLRDKVRTSLESVQTQLVTLKKTRALDMGDDEG